MRAELDCGCVVQRNDGLVWDYGWWDCPAGHGRQRLWQIIEPEPPTLIERFHERRRMFIRRHGKRELII